MKILRVLLFVVIGLFALYLIICAMGPKKVDVTRSLEMNASPSAIYSQVVNVEKWKDWGPWQQKDPTMEVTFGDKVEGQGASYSWKSEKMGDGNLEIIEAEQNKSLKTKLSFSNWDGNSYGSWNIEPTEDNKTKVSWGISSDNNVPFMMRGMMQLMNMKGQMAKDFDQGLANIKEIAEKMPSKPENIEEISHLGGSYVGVRSRVSWAEMEKTYQEGFSALSEYLGSSNMEPAGNPCAFYYEWDEENQMTDMAPAFPVGNVPSMGDPISTVEMDGISLDIYDNSVSLLHLGGYGKLGEAHNALGQWITDNEKEIVLPVMEEYIAGQMTEPDSSKWETRITYAYK